MKSTLFAADLLDADDVHTASRTASEASPMPAGLHARSASRADASRHADQGAAPPPVPRASNGFASLRTACTRQRRWDSPLGPLLLVRTARGLAGAWFEGQRHHPPALDAPTIDDDPLLERAVDQLERYFAAGLRSFDVPLDLHGSPFQRAVWAALLAIAPGTTRSYGAVAQALDCPRAVRAVGAAVGRNPVSILVPCHRVIGGDGSLTGYAGGLERKRALLRLEGWPAAATPTPGDRHA